MADFATALVRIPGTRNTSVFPGRDVIVETWEPECAYTVEQMIEDGLSASGNGLRT